MANVSVVRSYDRTRLPRTISGGPTGKTYQPIRRVRSEFQTNQTLQRDVSETLQHAALINIVAAVNEEPNGENVTKADVTVPGSAIDSLKNTVAVISNLMTPRHRSVSIPKQTHRVFTMSDDMVQKKPMYRRIPDSYERIHRVAEKYFDGYKGRDRYNNNPEPVCPSPVQSVKIMPVKTTYNDADFKIIEKNLLQASDKTNKAMEKAKESRAPSATSIRLLGSLKKTQTRKVHSVSKCDAVDLMDTKTTLFENRPGNEKDPAKAFLDDSRKLIPQSPVEPNIRPTSLPGAFPAKTKKFNRVKSSPPSKQHIYKNKNPIATIVSKDTPQSMYRRMMSLPGGFGYESLAIGNGVNQEPDIFSPLSHDSHRVPKPHVSFASLASSRNSKRLSTPRTPMTYSGESLWSECTVHRDQDIEMELQSVSQQLDAIQSAMGRYSRTRETYSENKENVNNQLDSNKVSHIGKSPRKVQFENREYSMSSDESAVVNESARPVVNGGSSIIQPPMSVFRSYSPAIQPMSAHELLRFKQRFFPANMPQNNGRNQSFFSTSSVLKINQVRTPTPASSHREESAYFETGTYKDTESEANLDDYMEEEADTYTATHITERENIALENVESQTDTNNQNSAHESDTKESSVDNNYDDSLNFYKIIKAIDTHAYSGFEHKKLRKHSETVPKSTGKQKDHYVKVKVG